MLTSKQLAVVTMGIEGHLMDALRNATTATTADRVEQLEIAGAVLTLMLRHYVRSCADPEGWLEVCIRAVLEPAA